MDREDHEMFIREDMPNKVLNQELYQFCPVDIEIYLFVSSLKTAFMLYGKMDFANLSPHSRLAPV